MREHPALSMFLAEAESGEANARSLTLAYAHLLAGGTATDTDRAVALTAVADALGHRTPAQSRDFTTAAEAIIDAAALRFLRSANGITVVHEVPEARQ